MKHRFYLYQIWKQDRRLAWLLVLLLLGQLFFMYKGVETFPFYHYGMYSAPAPQQQAPSTAIHLRSGEANGSYLALGELGNATFWAYQLKYYAHLQETQLAESALRQTIAKRFQALPQLEAYALKRLCNNKNALTHLEQRLKKRLNQFAFSIWEENFDWVNHKPKLVNKQFLYQWPSQ